MEIRLLQQHELLPALHLAWDVFVTEVAPGYTPEGVAEFQKFIKYENIHQMWQKGNIFFFGAYDGAELCGMLAFGPDGHIFLFFVRQQHQGKGIGRMLFQAVYNDCAWRLRIGKITVNSAPQAVEKYIHMGMHPTAQEQEMNGIRYVPMEMYVSPGMAQPVQRRSKTPVIIAVVIGVVLVIALIVGGIMLARSIQRNYQYRHDYLEPFEDYDDGWGSDDDWDYDDGWGSDDDRGSDEEELTGIQAIPESIAQDLSYEIEEETYSFSDEEKQSVVIEFNVMYPKITGLEDEKIEKQVNEALKECAMKTVDEIYQNPSDEIKERVLKETNPVLVNYGEYKVCYASENLISVAYEDYSYQGGENYYAQHLRTCNINLKDGRVYEVKDIVELNDEFLEKWLEAMREEVSDDTFLEELTKEEMKKTLEGDSLEGVYVVNFFVDEDGIEIGYDLNYPEDDSHNPGYVWVTAPFNWKEVDELHIGTGIF